MKSRVRMVCPVDGRGFDHVVFQASERERAILRERVRGFGDEHEGCAVASIGLPERALPHRCGDCALKLLFGEECPFHPGSHRVRWTEELQAAYVEAVDEIAGGLTPSVPAGVAGEVKHQAARLAVRWGRIQERPGMSRSA